MDMSQHPDNDTHQADPDAEARAEKVAWGIIVLIIAALGGGFATMGLTGVGLVAVATVPVIYLLLVIMAGGKG